jgi:hypothetical protein
VAQSYERLWSPPSRGERVATALDKRLPLGMAGKQFLRKAFPDHWSFLLGEIALYSLLVLPTGVFLSFFFHPDMTELPYTGSYAPLHGATTSRAYASVLHISFDVRGGLLLRQVHHWAAPVFVAETDLAGHTVAWDVFLPGVVLPTALFVVLYAYPFFERWITGPTPERHLCDRPRNRPTRTALGVAAVSVYAVLLMAGGQDVLSYVFHVPFEVLTYTFRTLLFVLPFVAYHLAKRACLGLQAADRRLLTQGRATAEVRRVPGGGYDEGRAPVSAEQAYRILVRDEPRPRAHGTEVWRRLRRHRVRNALSRWYFGTRVELPVTEWQRRRIEIARAAPGQAEDGGES